MGYGITYLVVDKFDWGESLIHKCMNCGLSGMVDCGDVCPRCSKEIIGYVEKIYTLKNELGYYYHECKNRCGDYHRKLKCKVVEKVGK